jgi:hypothetical protein
MQDPWQHPEAERYARDVLVNMVPKLKSSEIALSLVPGGEGDVKYWVELGASIMFDKPIIVVVTGDRKLPPKLELIADEIVRMPEDADQWDQVVQDTMTAAIERVLGV